MIQIQVKNHFKKQSLPQSQILSCQQEKRHRRGGEAMKCTEDTWAKTHYIIITSILARVPQHLLKVI